MTLHPDDPPLADRGPRRMPTLWGIASYWEPRGVFWVNLEQPHCFGCCNAGRVDLNLTLRDRWEDSEIRLDRAHLVDRCQGGLDGPQNLVPLCRMCHRVMPEFSDGQEAIGWVLAGGSWPVLQAKMVPMADALIAGQITVSEHAAYFAKLTGIPKHKALEFTVKAMQETPGAVVPARRPQPQPVPAGDQGALF